MERLQNAETSTYNASPDSRLSKRLCQKLINSPRLRISPMTNSFSAGVSSAAAHAGYLLTSKVLAGTCIYARTSHSPTRHAWQHSVRLQKFLIRNASNLHNSHETSDAESSTEARNAPCNDEKESFWLSMRVWRSVSSCEFFN